MMKATTCPQWLAFLYKIMAGNESMVDYLQRIIGYALTGSMKEQCLFIFNGFGANGKSTFLESNSEGVGGLCDAHPFLNVAHQ